MNPVRSLGPALVGGHLANLWIYLVGPTVGALLAVGIAYILRGPGGDEPAIRAAQGRLSEILRESNHGGGHRGHSTATPPPENEGERRG